MFHRDANPNLQPPADDQADDDERGRIEAWRLEMLLKAGYQRHRAELLAPRFDIDLRAAIALLESGCPQRTCLQILL